MLPFGISRAAGPMPPGVPYIDADPGPSLKNVSGRFVMSLLPVERIRHIENVRLRLAVRRILKRSYVAV